MANIFDSFFGEGAEDKFNAALDKILSKKVSNEDIINKIADYYLQIANILVSDYSSIKLDAFNFRQIKIDGKVYDLDALISHNQTDLTEILGSVDALFSDLISRGEKLKQCISEIEKKLNSR